MAKAYRKEEFSKTTEITYNVIGCTIQTKCNYQDGDVRVGSETCSRCPYYKGVGKKTHSVLCSRHEEEVDTKKDSGFYIDLVNTFTIKDGEKILVDADDVVDLLRAFSNDDDVEIISDPELSMFFTKTFFPTDTRARICVGEKGKRDKHLATEEERQKFFQRLRERNLPLKVRSKRWRASLYETYETIEQYYEGFEIEKHIEMGSYFDYHKYVIDENYLNPAEHEKSLKIVDYLNSYLNKVQSEEKIARRMYEDGFVDSPIWGKAYNILKKYFL